MIKEEAIEVLKDIYNYTRFDTYTTNEARTMAIKALEQEPCDEQDIYTKAYKDGYDKGYDDGYFIGKNGWISVNEKMPEKEGDCEYLVTTRNGLDILSFAKDLYKVDEYDFCDKKGVSGWFDYDSEYGYIEIDGVVAWMPLPQPYNAESEGKE